MSSGRSMTANHPEQASTLSAIHMATKVRF
jgi:hypothetical protein